MGTFKLALVFIAAVMVGATSSHTWTAKDEAFAGKRLKSGNLRQVVVSASHQGSIAPHLREGIGGSQKGSSSLGVNTVGVSQQGSSTIDSSDQSNEYARSDRRGSEVTTQCNNNGPNLLYCTVCEHALVNWNGRLVNGNGKLNLNCPSGIIRINSVLYGRQDLTTCKPVGLVNRSCSSTTALSVVTAICNGRRSCGLTATNAIFGDPCGGTQKYLTVGYTCQACTTTCDTDEYCVEDRCMKKCPVTDLESLETGEFSFIEDDCYCPANGGGLCPKQFEVKKGCEAGNICEKNYGCMLNVCPYIPWDILLG